MGERASWFLKLRQYAVALERKNSPFDCGILTCLKKKKKGFIKGKAKKKQ